MPDILHWLYAFVFTQAVEVPIYYAAFRVRPSVAFGASALTHPVLWFGIFAFTWPIGYWPQVAAGEAFAWLGEVVYFKLWMGNRLGTGRAVLWCGVANAMSLGLGLIARQLVGFP